MVKSFIAPCKLKIVFFIVIFSSFLLSATPFCIDLGFAGTCFVQFLGIFPLVISFDFLSFFFFLVLPTAALSYLLASALVLARGKLAKAGK